MPGGRTFVGTQAFQVPGGVQAINPSTLAWEVLLDSRQIPVVANGTPIALWPDTSGNARDANPVPGFNPLYRPAGNVLASPNNIALADFGAVANSQMFGTLPPAGLNPALGFSVYLWYVLDTVASAGGGDTQLIFGSDFANGWRTSGAFFQGVGDTRPEFTTNAANIIAGASVQATTGRHLLTAICNPPSGGAGTVNLYYDGTFVASGLWNAQPNTTYLVSGNAAQNVWLRGRLGFAGIGRRADSNRTRLGVEKYLRDTWG